MSNEVWVTVPKNLTPEMMRALRDSPLTGITDRDEWFSRLGWMICAWEILLEAGPKDRGHFRPL